ncbi:MAG: DUF438 domain-containing protein [Peptococcaceae bacterium]
MSELINNREYRKAKIKEIILELHQGKTVEEVKNQFDKLVKDIAPGELAAIEQELINEGLPVDEVRRLCDVHLEIFKKALAKTPEDHFPPGHPVHTFKLENRALEKLIAETQHLIEEFKDAPGQDKLLRLREKINLLWDVEKHYIRKENLLFPFLEKYEITGPSKIMWSHDDEIRTLLKEVKKLAVTYNQDVKNQLPDKLESLLQKMLAMIDKEEKVLFDTSLKALTEDEWYHIMQDSAEIGYCLIEPRHDWKPAHLNIGDSVKGTDVQTSKGYLKFASGVLTLDEINLILNHLPVDITFVDKKGIVKYFSANKDRIFVRARSIIGRKVENCHPPASVDIVEKLVEDLASGKKDREDFWLHLGDKYVYIRYIAVRDEQNEFIGVVEVSQDIKPFLAIKGEKRIAD